MARRDVAVRATAGSRSRTVKVDRDQGFRQMLLDDKPRFIAFGGNGRHANGAWQRIVDGCIDAG